MSGAFFYEHIVDYFVPVPQDNNNNVAKSTQEAIKKPKKKLLK